MLDIKRLLIGSDRNATGLQQVLSAFERDLDLASRSVLLGRLSSFPSEIWREVNADAVLGAWHRSNYGFIPLIQIFKATEPLTPGHLTYLQEFFCGETKWEHSPNSCLRRVIFNLSKRGALDIIQFFSPILELGLSANQLAEILVIFAACLVEAPSDRTLRHFAECRSKRVQYLLAMLRICGKGREASFKLEIDGLSSKYWTLSKCDRERIVMDIEFLAIRDKIRELAIALLESALACRRLQSMERLVVFSVWNNDSSHVNLLRKLSASPDLRVADLARECLRATNYQ